MAAEKSIFIRPLRLGTQTTYLIPAGDGFVMVDAGNRNCGRVFARKLRRWGIEPQMIKLLVMTHVHFDHAGSAAAIQKQTGCRVAVHAQEDQLLSSGQAVIPPGINWYGRLISGLGIKSGTHRFDFPGVEPDILVQGEEDLSRFGLAGRIISTPGHTEGSISVVLDSGQAFVGDAVIRYAPILSPCLPPFGYDRDRMLRTWEALLQTRTKVFYPGHGWPFTDQELAARHRLLISKREKRTAP